MTEDQVVNFLYMEDEIATGDEAGSCWCVYTFGAGLCVLLLAEGQNQTGLCSIYSTLYVLNRTSCYLF